MDLQQKSWAIFDTEEKKIAAEYSTREEARRVRAFSVYFRGSNGCPNMKRFRIARVTKQVSVEIISK